MCIRDRDYSEGLDKHPLRREIITNAVVNNMVCLLYTSRCV